MGIIYHLLIRRYAKCLLRVSGNFPSCVFLILPLPLSKLGHSKSSKCYYTDYFKALNKLKHSLSPLLSLQIQLYLKVTRQRHKTESKKHIMKTRCIGKGSFERKTHTGGAKKKVNT